jgi:serine/threonine-protein kinase
MGGMRTRAVDRTPCSWDAALAPGTLVGDFRVERRLGDGGSATVYAATHQHIGKKAAIKVLAADLNQQPIAVERLVEEARAVNQIAHPNIIDIFDAGQLPDGRTYLVMEWLPGQPLDSALDERVLSLAEIVDILMALCDALEAAHEAGFVHRDLKPANVFLATVKGRSPQVKLLDFGIAKLPAEPGPSRKRTRTGWLLGTPDYLSPEQARGLRIEPRTDVYALGVMAYEMFVGRRPFLAEYPIDIIDQHLRTPPPSPRGIRPELPAGVENLLLWMLNKNVQHRPTVAQVRGSLTVLRELRGEPAARTVENRGAPRASRRRVFGWVVAMAIALAAGALAGWRWWPEPPRVAAIEPPVAVIAPPPVLPVATKRAPRRPPRQQDYLLDPFAGGRR